MSEKEEKSATPESQRERWIKYGGNVVLASIVVVLIAVLVIWLSQEANARVDTTTSGMYSLKPQTINLIKDNKQKIKLVSLYTRAKKKDPDAVEREEDKFDFITPVSDLLDEYKRKGKNIDVETIDPGEAPMKVDQLIADVSDRYGGEIAKYKAVVKDYPDIYSKIEKLAGDEQKIVEQLPTVKSLQESGAKLTSADRDWVQALELTMGTVYTLPKFLKETRSGIDRILQQKIPDYKGATNAIDVGMSTLSQMIEEQLAKFQQVKDNPKFPQDIRDYIASSTPRFTELKKLSDDLGKRVRELGELKLDTLKQSLKQEDVILVMGENDIRVLTRDKVWQPQPAPFGRPANEKLRPRFAGEQQITSAILALNSTSKPRIVFVRSGGRPLVTSMNPFQPPDLGILGERLADYNFDVKEKDISGMWAMQSQQMGMPPEPEPSDEEIKDALWVVLALPSRQQGPMGGMDMALGEKLREHLSQGGSALVLAERGATSLGASLDDWGVKVRGDVVAVHEPINTDSDSGDIVEQAQRNSPIFVINNYGDHLLTKPLASLDALMLAGCVVQTENKPGFTSTPLLPVPEKLKVWGETNMESLAEPKFDKDADIGPPLFWGSVVEKQGGGRLVVIGSVALAVDQFISFSDSRSRSGATRFPGNGELLMNSIFWLSKMEPMIAISPAAMDVNRIKQINPGPLNFWRVGVLLVILPGMVLLAGATIYAKRRD
jgi:hypothetical protein